MERLIDKLMHGKKPHRYKNPIAVALGKLGGSKGGNARKKTTSKERLSEIGFIGSVYGRMGRGIRVPKEEIELARKLQEKNKE